MLVLPGDNLIEADTIASFAEVKTEAMLVKRVDNPVRYGVVTIGRGMVKDIVENRSAAAIRETVRQHQPDVVVISALMTNSMSTQKEVVQVLSEAGLRSQVKIMVGGGPVSQEWADEIGADAYGVNAVEAVIKAKALLSIDS